MNEQLGYRLPQLPKASSTDEDATWTLSYSFPRFPQPGYRFGTYLAPPWSLEMATSDTFEGEGAITSPLPQTKTCPDLGVSADSVLPENELDGVVTSTGPLPMTKTCPDLGGEAQSAVPGRKPPYRFDDADRTRSQETRRSREYVETALTCNACYAAPTCSAFQREAVCSLIPTFRRFHTRNAQECVAKLRQLIAALEERAWRSYYFEKLDGGGATQRVTLLFNRLMKWHKVLFDLYQELRPSADKVVLDGETILTRIFGPQAKTRSALSDSNGADTL